LSCTTTHCVLSGHDKVNNSIGWKVNYGPESVQGTTSFNVDNADGTDYPTTTDKSIELVEWKALIGEDDKINKELPKLLQFKYRVPDGYHNSFVFNIENVNFDSEKQHIDFCNIAIVQAGNNLPCVHAWEDTVTRSLTNDTDTDYAKVLSNE